MAAIFSKLVRNHKHEVQIFNKYYAVNRVCNKDISKLLPKNFYNHLSSHIIGFAKVRSFKLLTHLITEYAELEEEDVQYINWKTKEPISGKTLFEEFVKKIEWNQEALSVQKLYSPAQIVSMLYIKYQQMRAV